MASSTVERQHLEKVPTAIPGFDFIADGGLPKGRATLLSGTPGTAKTTFALQFLAAGVQKGEPGVLVTFEEPADAIRKNVRAFGWDIAGWEAEGKWATVDVSPNPEENVATGAFDLSALLTRIEHAVRRVKATRVALDAPSTMLAQLPEGTAVRRELFRITAALNQMGVTSLITGERVGESSEVSRFGVEEFVSDNVILMRNTFENGKRRRTIEILKFRGTTHNKGAFPFTVGEDGIVVIPLSEIALTQKSSNIRVPSGNPDIDKLCGGGFFRDSIVLIAGAPGCGKTLMGTGFLAAGVANGERCLLVSFEESHDQFFRNARSWNIDLEPLEKSGGLRTVCCYPESSVIEDHLVRIKRAIEEFKPHRISIDTVSALEHITSETAYREFVIALTSFLKDHQICSLLITASPMTNIWSMDTHIFTLVDAIILLRYVDLEQEFARVVTILKMRGSAHEKQIREFTIDGTGFHVGQPLSNVGALPFGQQGPSARRIAKPPSLEAV